MTVELSGVETVATILVPWPRITAVIPIIAEIRQDSGDEIPMYKTLCFEYAFLSNSPKIKNV